MHEEQSSLDLNIVPMKFAELKSLNKFRDIILQFLSSFSKKPKLFEKIHMLVSQHFLINKLKQD